MEDLKRGSSWVKSVGRGGGEEWRRRKKKKK